MNLTKLELLSKCEELGITKCKSKNKGELINMINSKHKIKKPKIEFDIENDEELISNIINQKKKKINTIKSMILKRCKNINQSDNIEDEVNNEEFESTELSIESEYI